MNLLSSNQRKTIVKAILAAGITITLSSCGGSPSTPIIPATPANPAAATQPAGGNQPPASAAVTPKPPATSVPPSTGQPSSPLTVDNRYTASLVFSAATVKAGDSFTIDVVINSTVPTRGAQCALTFDPKLMKCEAATEGDYYKKWAAANTSSTLIFPQPKIDNAAGTVSDMGVAVMSQKEGGPTGSGVLCSYKFTALGAGTVAATLSNVLVADPAGKMAKAVIK